MGTSVGPIDELPQPLDPADVNQDQIIGPAILVRPDGPVSVHALPAKSGPITFDAVDSGIGSWVKILNRDAKRKRATILANPTVVNQTSGMLISRTGSGTTGAPWPLIVPLVVEHGDELWALAADDQVVVTAVTEIWAS